MKIDWFTVLAQVINFLILVWLLKRFLYKPILKAIDERENRIASQLKDAETKKAEAKKEQYEFRQKNDKFDLEKKELMNKAIAETKAEREKLFEEARNEAAILSSKLEKALNESQENLSSEIAKNAKQEVFAISRKALSDLASQSLEEQMANVFIKRLNELNKDEKKQFIEAFISDSNTIDVRSVFELSIKQQTEIKSSVNEILGTKTQFVFETSPELVSGIELTSNSYKLAWSISEYLNLLQKSIDETLKEESKTKLKEEKKHDSKNKIESNTKEEPKVIPEDVQKPDSKTKPKPTEKVIKKAGKK
jgi:F-type H+-transporting ATPase subunit b